MVDRLYELFRDIWLMGAGADALSQCCVNPGPIHLLPPLDRDRPYGGLWAEVGASLETLLVTQTLTRFGLMPLTNPALPGIRAPREVLALSKVLK